MPSNPISFLRHPMNRAVESVRDIRRRLARIESSLTDLRGAVSAQQGTVDTLASRLDDLQRTFDGVARRIIPVGTSNRDDWSAVAQEGELAFHQRDRAFRGNDAEWQIAVDKDWRSWGFSPVGWEGKTVVDVGAGSRLRSLWFSGADIVVIEPLADRYLQIEWSDLNQARAVYSAPGEELIPELVGTADLVTSINALDHGYSLEESFANIRRYLKPDGEAFVSIDMHDTVSDHMHPMVVKHDDLVELFGRVGLELVKSEEWYRRFHCGAGPNARNYWLRPAAATVGA